MGYILHFYLDMNMYIWYIRATFSHMSLSPSHIMLTICHFSIPTLSKSSVHPLFLTFFSLSLHCFYWAILLKKAVNFFKRHLITCATWIFFLYGECIFLKQSCSVWFVKNPTNFNLGGILHSSRYARVKCFKITIKI